MRENYEVFVISKLHTLPQCEMPLEWIDLLAVSGQSVSTLVITFRTQWEHTGRSRYIIYCTVKM